MLGDQLWRLLCCAAPQREETGWGHLRVVGEEEADKVFVLSGATWLHEPPDFHQSLSKT